VRAKNALIKPFDYYETEGAAYAKKKIIKVIARIISRLRNARKLNACRGIGKQYAE
jgi:hypothetical protein